MCFTLRLHMSAAPPRGGLTQALGAMTDYSDTEIYSAPKSGISQGKTGTFISSFQTRFWLACLICGIVLPWLVFAFMEINASALLLYLFVFIYWLVPVGWIFLHEMKFAGFRKISTTRFVLISLGYSIATTTIALISLAFLGAVLYIYESLRHGT
jgi:hypothetical protein